MNDVLMITACSVGIPSIAWMVVSIRRLAVMQRITEQALCMSTQAQIPNVLRASADLASTLTSDLGRPNRMILPRLRRALTPEFRSEQVGAMSNPAGTHNRGQYDQ